MQMRVRLPLTVLALLRLPSPDTEPCGPVNLRSPSFPDHRATKAKEEENAQLPPAPGSAEGGFFS
jgi:hypothetical protein